MASLQVYQPVSRLKLVVENIWIVDSPEVRLQYWGLKLPFTTRMTIVRLPGGTLSSLFSLQFATIFGSFFTKSVEQTGAPDAGNSQSR